MLLLRRVACSSATRRFPSISIPGVLLAAALVLAGAQQAWGQLPNAHQSAPDVDVRHSMLAGARSIPSQGVALFERPALGGPSTVTVGELKVGVEELFGAPKYVRRDGRLLGIGQGSGALAAEQTLRQFIDDHPQVFGVESAALDSCRVTRDAVTRHNGMRSLIMQQTLSGIDVFGSTIKTVATADGELAMVSSTLLPLGSVSRAAAGITAQGAVEVAAVDAGIVLTEPLALASGPEGEDQEHRFERGTQWFSGPSARLMYFPLPDGETRLSWFVLLSMSQGNINSYANVVDAASSDILFRCNLTRFDGTEPATYSAFSGNTTGPFEPLDSPTPFSPGHDTPSAVQPSAAAGQPRAQISIRYDDFLDPQPSPDGWLFDEATAFSGWIDQNAGEYAVFSNHVIPVIDRNADYAHDFPLWPDAISPYRDFTAVIDPPDLGQDPYSYSDFSMMQLFYLGNLVHDRFYALGFDEAHGNFQENNFGRGGQDSDPIFTFVQFGASLGSEFANNAWFATGPDGEPGGLGAYVYNGAEPDRDSALDAEVMIHEFTHGLSNRLVDPQLGIGLYTNQSSGLGEGWSDFMALSMLAEPGDDPHGVYPSAGYVAFRLYGLETNYYFGDRRYPYCTDLNKNPLTFADIDPAQFSVPVSGQVPRSPIGNFNPSWADEEHNQGEVWCSALWQCRGYLIDSLGFEGNEVMMRLVVDGLKLTPGQPTYIEARDAIYLADEINYAGAHAVELARGFTDRGLGRDAEAPPTTTTNGVVESFDLPAPDVSVRADVTQGKAPLHVTFNGAVVGPLAGSADVAWDFGDGFVMEDETTVAHVYSQAGTYTVSFTASFDLGTAVLSSTATVVIQVTEDINVAPTARITAEFPSEETSLRIDFRSTGGDPDGRIIMHEWSFGDGTFASGQQVSHVFPAVGTYQVQLTVTDDRGGKATTVRSFEVGRTGFDIESLPPSAQPNPSDTGGSSCGAIGTVNLLLTLLGVTALRGLGPRRRR